ncbi:MAG: hypothetical protein II572_00700, partial [Clostridia bacterium]|nr:hypothetical protein [Clostridia bacterium]
MKALTRLPSFSRRVLLVKRESIEGSRDFTETLCVFEEGFPCARAHRLTQAGAVNGSRARALAARPPNLRRSPAHLRNVSRWKGKNHAITQKPSWIECSIEPKTGKVDDFHPFPRNPSTFSRPKKSKSMISGRFPKIHRLSQNWQNAKSMISSCFPEIHRLSQNWQNAKSMIS